MENEQFDNTKWHKGIQVRLPFKKQPEVDVISVDFSSRLVFVRNDNGKLVSFQHSKVELVVPEDELEKDWNNLRGDESPEELGFTVKEIKRPYGTFTLIENT